MLALHLLSKDSITIQAGPFSWQVWSNGKFQMDRIHGRGTRTGHLELDYRGFTPVLMIKYDSGQIASKRLSEDHPIYEPVLRWFLGIVKDQLEQSKC